VLGQTLGAGVELAVECDERLWDVEADRSQLEQVLMSLALNSREAMPDGGELVITAENAVMRDQASPSSRAVRLTVADTGRGMAREVTAHAFEPFFTTKAVSGHGVGLGLATVYGIVTQAGGHVDLYSELGCGTAVKVLLPVSRDAVPETGPGEEAAPGGGRGETILVVEDEPSVRALAALLLEGAGYEVVQAAGAEEALELATSHPVDLMLIDVVMPGMSGSDLAAALWKRQPELRVLYMSGYTDDIVMRHGVLERRLAFLEKPFTRAGLLRAVRERLDDVEEVPA
jgi:two-component system, cell cycle sensor histidine kinase and response regulator CckA